MDKAKPFCISKREVWTAYKRVKANGGAAGVDDQTIAEFEKDLSNNLYRLWNRMSSGSYLPPPVRRVDIPKGDGGTRPLGIPTVSDRIAQTVVKRYLEPLVEPVFHEDSYGYRPGRSAHDALAVARQRCWRHDWVLDLDIKGFFDNIDWELLMRAVRRHTDSAWVLLYIERWLRAPVSMPDGTLVGREKGTPQGSPISPLLANLFMHYAFDTWIAREFPGCPFERYADDCVAHCDTEDQARTLRAAIATRLQAVGLELHPEKTKVVYCKDGRRRGHAEHTSFDFLGYTFRARRANGRRGLFVGFMPAMSHKARTAVGRTIRAWHLNRRTGTDLSSLARALNAQIRGWLNYYGAFYRSELYSLAMRINEHLVRWAMQKFKRLRGNPTRAWEWVDAVRQHQPQLFAHWHMLPRTTSRPVGAG